MADSVLDTKLSDYERKRLENLQRNEEKLRELGLETSKNQKRQKTLASSSSINQKKKEILYEIPTRRSSRLATQSPIDYKETNVYENTRTIKVKSETLEDQEDLNNTIKVELAPGEFKGLDTTIIKQEIIQDNNNINQKGEFSSSSNANIDLLVTKYIGNPLEEFGKAAVMKLANYGREPRFNKFQGVVEWVNCIFLWVNLEGSTGYSNTFSNEGRHMMWFGGSKMTSESKVVQRLINYGRPSPLALSSSIKQGGSYECPIFLFVRHEQEGYCCLGRVVYLAVDLTCHPVEFKWELLDYDILVQNSKYFRELLKQFNLK